MTGKIYLTALTGTSTLLPEGVAKPIVIGFIILYVIYLVYTDMRKEIDLASGVSSKSVRKYYRKLFHSKKIKEEYRNERIAACGCEEGADERTILRAQATKVKQTLSKENENDGTENKD